MSRRHFPDRRTLALGAAVAALVAAVVVGVVVARGNDKAAPVQRSASGPEAPSFHGKDPVTGRAVGLASFRGRPVVVNVWFSTCPGCNEEAGDLRTFDRRHPGVLLGIDVQDTTAGRRSSTAAGAGDIQAWPTRPDRSLRGSESSDSRPRTFSTRDTRSSDRSWAPPTSSTSRTGSGRP